MSWKINKMTQTKQIRLILSNLQIQVKEIRDKLEKLEEEFEKEIEEARNVRY